MKKRTKVIILVGVVALLVGARLAAPVVIKNHLNDEVLADLGDYRGSVDNVRLALWRGAVRVEDLRIEKTVGRTWVDFVIVPAVDVSIAPSALFRRIIRTTVVIEDPEINFVDGDEEDVQTGAGLHYEVDPDPPDPLFEFELEKLEIRSGTVAFRNFISDPEVNLQARNIDITGTELVVVDNGERDGTLELTGQLLGDSPLSIEAEFNPVDYRTFVFAAEASIVDIRRLNDFFQAYADLDFSSGEGNLVMELRAEDGRLTGYARPLLDNMEVIDWEEGILEQLSEPFHLLREGALGAILAVFGHPDTGELATEVEFSGEVPETMDADAWAAIFTMMRNAFVEAIDTDFESATPLTDEVSEGLEEVEKDIAEGDDGSGDEDD
ncbi:DUF748 domain-containing protein [Marinimicrobium sp. ABcell2]|uniref:DUF748 domain-containing protein n=1 Tax=Marinimicrobium sp. ABcell2 TaxID=3069751 RepID=UPI0027B0FEFC|nr:DUF748 domain-containing protein [Marinimicrobium sp. ABcell2]MDQ2076020.1 DUF748 domain-containing protein [Marinimicrobium sp. ABcell2]